MLIVTTAVRQEPRSGQRWLTPSFLLAGLCFLALALRIWRVGHGLPDFQEEAFPFKKALEMWDFTGGPDDFNPHFFNYPSLTLYLQFFLQKLYFGIGHLAGTFETPADYWLQIQLDPTWPVILGRSVGIVSDVFTLLGVWVIGERIRPGVGPLAALLIALSATMLTTSRLIMVDSVMTALAVWAVERMLTFLKEGGNGRLTAAVILIGLAAGAKYTSGLLVLPLAWVLWVRWGRRGLMWWPLAAAASLGVFLLTSPFILLDYAEFKLDFGFERFHMATGHLGSIERHGALFYLKTLVANWGWVALVCLATAAVATWRRRKETVGTTTVTLWLVVLSQAVSISSFRMEAAHYLLPLLPAMAVLVAWGALETADLAGRYRVPARLVMVVLLMVPTVWWGGQAALTGGDTTQQQARRWCEDHISADINIVQEPYGASLRTVFDIDFLRNHDAFSLASRENQQQLELVTTYRSVVIPMATSGRYTITINSPSQPPRKLIVLEHATELNQIFYEPALYRDVDYFISSGSVRGRYENNPTRYPSQVRFYEMLQQQAEVVAEFAAGGSVAGSSVTIYHLGDGFQKMLELDTAPLELYWWARAVPMELRLTADSLLAPPGELSDGAIRLPSGLPAHWVRNLDDLFDEVIRPFLIRLAHNMAETQHYHQARRLAACILGMRPDNVSAVLIFSSSASQTGHQDQAIRAVTHSLKVLERRGLATTQLHYELAWLYYEVGDGEAARQEVELLLQDVAPASEMAQFARRLLEKIEAQQADQGP